jgi:hypothetical protein
MPIYECNNEYDTKYNSCIVEIFCTLVKILVESKRQHEEARGYKEPNAGYPTDRLGKRA